jgi:hypothetical protein
MDFDPVEMIHALEEWFGITIPDHKAERMRTVGDLYFYVLEQTRRGSRSPCPTSRAFYHLRRALVGALGVDRARVRPATLLRDLVPAEARETAWPCLAAALDLPDLPDPDPPSGGPTLRSLGVALGTADLSVWVLNLLLLLLLGGPVAFAALAQLWLLMWCLVMLGVGMIWGVFWLEARERRRVPKVRDLVLRLVRRDCDFYLADDAAEPTPATVWADLVAILSAHMGVPADKFEPEQQFYDLNSPWS